MAGRVLVTGPVKEPVSLAELKDFLRIDGTDSDADVHALNNAARRYAERLTNRAFISQTWDFTLDAFPSSSDVGVEIPAPPLQSITSITYTDPDGNTGQTWSSGSYTVFTYQDLPGLVKPTVTEDYPDTQEVRDAITIRAVVGYGDDPQDVPETLRVAIRFLVGHWFEHREPIIAGTTVAPVPSHIDALLNNERIFAF